MPRNVPCTVSGGMYLFISVSLVQLYGWLSVLKPYMESRDVLIPIKGISVYEPQLKQHTPLLYL